MSEYLIGIRGEGTILVRDDNYMKEFNGFLRADHYKIVSIALEMERALLGCHGYPTGSSPANLDLIQFGQDDWEQPLQDIEAVQSGAARVSLEFFDRQRIYRKDGVSIVYVIIEIGGARIIYLGALTTYENMIPDILWKMINARP
jgi:hypothetical protein